MTIDSLRAWEREGDASRRAATATRTALAVLGAFTLLRLALVFLPNFGLLPQDAYYVFYARNPSLSYYDHPPMIAVVVRLATWLFGETEVGLRLGLLLTTIGTQLAFFALAGRFLGPRAQARALVLFTATGLVMSLSLQALPDVPMLLFWTLALLALERALFADWRPGWLLAGLAMGLAFASKYTGLYLQAGLLLYLVLSRRHRHWLGTVRPYAALALAHLVCLPVYVWNLQHGFASFLFQTQDRAASSLRLSVAGVAGFLVVQALVFLPVGLALLLRVTGRHLARGWARRGRLPARTLFLLCFSAPLVATCLGLSAFTWVKSNWLLPAAATGFILAAPLAGRRALGLQAAAGVLLHAALGVAIVFHPVPIPVHENWAGWSELGREVEALAAEHPDAFVFSVDSYKTTAELLFYTDLKVYGRNVVAYNALHFDYLGDDLDALAGRDALLIRAEPKLRPGPASEAALAQVRRFFADVEELAPILVRHRGRTVRMFRVFWCHDYRGPRLPDG